MRNRTSLFTDFECWPANIAHLQTSIAILDFECTFCSTASLNTAVPISNCYLIARFRIQQSECDEGNTNKNPKSKICPVDRRRKTATICMYFVSKRGPNTCKKQICSLPKSTNKLMKKLLQCNMQMATLVQ